MTGPSLKAEPTDSLAAVTDDRRHVAVIDLGSNSVRLVVYDQLSRTPFPRSNEKFLCHLGASLDDEGNLGEEAMDCTVRALGRAVRKRPRRLVKALRRTESAVTVRH